MLDPQLCSSSPLLWTTIAGYLSDIFFSPKVVLFSIAIFIGLAIFCHFRFRNLQKVLISLVFISLSPLILSLILTSAPVVNFAYSQLMKFPSDAIAKSDAIVILGRGGDARESRVKLAADLWRSQQAPTIFASGRGDALEMESMLKAIAIPEKAINGEDCSRTTAENAEFTSLILKPQGVHRILLITDPPHMLRSILTFRRYGFEVTAVPSNLNPNLGSQTLLILREYFALITYKILGRLA